MMRPPIDSEESINVLISCSRKQFGLLGGIFKKTDVKTLSNVGMVAEMLVTAVNDSCSSLLLLAEHRRFRDCLVTARTIYLTILNICFICARGEAAAQRATRHAHQKAYRDRRRELRVNDKKMTIEWPGAIDLDKLPELKAALREFTGSKGHEKRTWTDENVQQQLEAVDLKYGKEVSLLLLFGLNLYRHASELAHGTLFGVLWALGTFEPNGQQREAREGRNQHPRGILFLTLLIVNCCVVALNRVLEKEGLSPDVAERSNTLLQDILDKICFEPPKNSTTGVNVSIHPSRVRDR